MTEPATVAGNLGETSDAPMPDFGVRQATDNLAYEISVAAQDWHEGDGTIGIDSATAKLLRDTSSEITRAVAALRASADEADDWMTNLDLHPDGRRARAQAAVEAGKQSAAEALRNAEGCLDLAEAMLINDSAPSWGDSTNNRNAAMERARADALMVLNSDKGDMVDKVRMLAEHDSPLSTLVTSDWLDLYLASRGVNGSDRAMITDAAREYALNARANRGNKSAQLVFKARKGLRGTIGATKSLAKN